MSYIGSTPTNQNFVAGSDQFNGTGSQTIFTLSRNVNTVNDIQVVVSNVPQDPFTAYSVAGNSLTFTSAPPAGTGNIYVTYRATNVQYFVPSPLSVSTPQIVDSSITTDKIADASITAAKMSGAQSGSAPAYAARAWVNFNGTGTVAIRASGNVSSITDNGTGDYTVNFTTAMPDANYATVITGRRPSGSTEFPGFFTTTLNTGSMQMAAVQPGVSFYDSAEVSVAIFR